MNFLATLAACALGAWLGRNFIKKNPLVLYGISLALTALYLVMTQTVFPAAVRTALLFLVQKGTLALALFCLVMFIGAFPRGSKVRTALGPIRRELSLAGCILILGHAGFYLVSFAGRMGAHPMGGIVMVALAIALVLLVLVAVLGITSVSAVKAKMNAATWSKVHKLAYAFYALTYVHLAIMLAPSAVLGSAHSAANLLAYTVVFGAYAVLRVRLALTTKKTA